jgi:tRNA A37 threonylcarbamoyladenosine dehydratase
MDWLTRTELLLGDEKMNRLRQANILVVGLGGVGAYAVEQLVRTGIENITIVDGDTVNPSNRNRQLAALVSTENQRKTEVVAARLKDINPELNLTVIMSLLNMSVFRRFWMLRSTISLLMLSIH